MHSHPYLRHLLADIAAAHRSEAEQHPQRPLFEDPQEAFEAEMADIERWISGEVEAENTSLAQYAGLDLETFPPAAQFPENDLAAVVDAVRKMAHTYNHGLDFPENVPAVLQYELMLEWLAEPTFIPAFGGMLTWDCCTGDAPGCRLGEYCPCLRIWAEWEDGDPANK